MLGGMRTSKDGPVVASERTLRALFAIRRAVLLPKLYGTVVVGRSSYEAILATAPPEMADWPWLAIEQDRPEVELPARIAGAPAPDAAALRLALALNASLVLLEDPTKERAKLSFIKAEGTVAILVQAYRQGHLSAVRPMVKALEKLGHREVLPPAEQLEAMWLALENMKDG